VWGQDSVASKRFTKHKHNRLITHSYADESGNTSSVNLSNREAKKTEPMHDCLTFLPNMKVKLNTYGWTTWKRGSNQQNYTMFYSFIRSMSNATIKRQSYEQESSILEGATDSQNLKQLN
jgi:hypothetical protein